jgi:hypothetical protein
MAGTHYLAANQINADTAGLTSVEPQVPTVAPASATEQRFSHLASNVGNLGYLFGHDFTHEVSTNLATVAEGMTSALGGIIRPNHVAAVAAPMAVDGHPDNGTVHSVSVPTIVDTTRMVASDLRQRGTSLVRTLRANLGI